MIVWGIPAPPLAGSLDIISPNQSRSANRFKLSRFFSRYAQIFRRRPQKKNYRPFVLKESINRIFTLTT